MINPMATNDRIPSIEASVGDAVAKLAGRGRRIVDSAFYHRESDHLVLICMPFAVLIDREAVDELRRIPPDDMSLVRLSAAGTTIIVEKHDVYIEAAGLVSEKIQKCRAADSGGLVMELVDNARSLAGADDPDREAGV